VSYNLPTVTTDDISFGPARLFLGPSGATPTVDVGAISDDGITLEITSEKRDITQGNPQIIEHSFTQKQGLKVSVTGIEWDFTNLQYALGAGNTASSVSLATWNFGGDPVVETVAIHVRHEMATSGDTLNVYVWKARGEGSVSIQLAQDEHSFPYAWMAMRASTNWGGTTLAKDEQLFQITRQLT